MERIKTIYKIIFIRQHRVHFYLNILRNKRNKLIKTIVRNILISKYHISIGQTTIIGENITLPHQYNITIGDGVVVGSNCQIYHNVTIGQNNGKYPIIEDGVTIYTGAIIIGNIKIGSNAIIGAGSVVTKDVPSNYIAAGIPAKLIRIRTEYE